jgi:hypothetical protein
MSTRCKFVLTSRKQNSWSTAEEFIFTPQYDTSIPEDRRFQKASPSGEFKIFVDNPVVQENFRLGASYYFDITEVPKESNE